MTKYDKTEFTADTLFSALETARKHFYKANALGDKAAKKSWACEINRIKTQLSGAIRAGDSISQDIVRGRVLADELLSITPKPTDEEIVLANSMNELYRTTDMKQASEEETRAWEKDFEAEANNEAADLEHAEKEKRMRRAKTLYADTLWFVDGVAYARTPSCGCCSEAMSSSEDDYDFKEIMTNLDSLAMYVEAEEARVLQLRKDFNDYASEQENG